MLGSGGAEGRGTDLEEVRAMMTLLDAVWTSVQRPHGEEKEPFFPAGRERPRDKVITELDWEK